MLEAKQYQPETGHPDKTPLRDNPEPTLKMRGTHYHEETDTCPTCGHPFTPKRPWQRFCSIICRRQHHRRDTRDLVLDGIISTAKALGYTKAGFLAKMDSIWE